MRFAFVVLAGSLWIAFHKASVAARHKSDCEKSPHRKQTMKLIKETAFSGLFRDVKNQTKWEASGVAAVHGKFWVVFDSSYSLGMVDDRFEFRGSNNKLIGEPGGDSQFEGIAYSPADDQFHLLHEVDPSQSEDEPYKPSISTVKIRKDLSKYDVVQKCQVDFELTHENKGFESIIYVTTDKGENFLLGLCEGNYCVGGSKGREPGNGRIVVTRLKVAPSSRRTDTDVEAFSDDRDMTDPMVDDDTETCVWEVVKIVDVPSSAYFRDYADMAYNYVLGKLAIVSQEDAAIWIGDFDIDALDFKSNEGEIYHLPRDNDCRVVYCNAEGLQWLDNYRLLVASDKAKSRQPFWCDAHDQAIHIFAFPPAWNPHASGQTEASSSSSSSSLTSLYRQTETEDPSMQEDALEVSVQ